MLFENKEDVSYSLMKNNIILASRNRQHNIAHIDDIL